MSTHINAQKGEIAETVLLPGDPLRAKHIAENMLDKAFCYNEVRAMYGYTGEYKGKLVSVQGTGMGVPSISIYVNELVREYDVKNLIRVGTCGSIQPDLNIRDIVLAMTASTDSAVNKLLFDGMDYSPTASFKLLFKAYEIAVSKGIDVKAGNILTCDSFYHEQPDFWKKWAEYGVLALEMETTALYTLASKYNVQALTILTVSDNIVTGDQTSSEERESTFKKMVEIALELIP